MVNRRKNGGKRYEVMVNVNGGIDIDFLVLEQSPAF